MMDASCYIGTGSEQISVWKRQKLKNRILWFDLNKILTGFDFRYNKISNSASSGEVTAFNTTSKIRENPAITRWDIKIK